MRTVSISAAWSAGVLIVLGPALAGCLATPEHDAGAERTAAPAAAERADPPAPPLRPKRTLDPDALLGKTRAEARALFGAPKAIRERPPGVVWTYGGSGSGCAMSLFFYMDVGSETYRVLTYEMTADSGDEPTCYGDLRHERG